MLLITGTVLFRIGRSLDVLAAEDRAAFTLEAAMTLLETPYDLLTTWCCFVQGMVVGHVKPPPSSSSSFARHVAFVSAVMGSATIPPAIALALTGVDVWLVAVVRLTLLPSLIGLLVETLQRRVFLRALLDAVRNEQAISLPAPSAVEADGATEQPSVVDYEPISMLGFGARGRCDSCATARASWWR